MPNNTITKEKIKLKKNVISIDMQKMNLIPHFFLEMLHFKKYLFSVLLACLTTHVNYDTIKIYLKFFCMHPMSFIPDF